ncbi:MAG TPA: transposase [Candidatus Saccharimonadia bacterium]|nr:transposase [Candidatus Saccharimonadia bacterium]
MRLLQSVLPSLRQTKKPQQKFVAHLLGLLLMLPGHATFRNLSRYSSYHERTFSRWYARDFDFVSLNKAAITAVIPPEHEQALVIDASFVPKSGKKTYGLDRFWNGSHSRTEKGLEISALAWLDITDNCAYCLSAEQTPPVDKTTDAEATRIDVYLDQLARVVSAHHLRHLRYVISDGYYSKQKFLGGVRALGLEQIGKLRLDANLRYLYQGSKRPGPGRPQTYDGKVHWDNLSRFEKVATEDDDIVLYHQVLNHIRFQCNLHVVLVVDTTHNRKAVLFSTDLHLDALTIYRYYKARFQIEFLFRDAKQFAGLTDCQARSQAKLNFHFHASLSAVTLAKLEARQHNGGAASGLSMASLKRRAFNQHLIERISQYLAKGHSLEKSSPDYEELCNYGTITETAA